MTKPIVLGTAGHIDHGKTSLIRALTGIDTDRLKEEKARGITIELGFAHLTLPNGERVGIVDVPGHEKFVKHMVAGAMGVDLVALVIAADEGVMLQTREHMDICQLLGVRQGLIVLTKIDLTDEEWLELVEEDIREFVKGTFLENAPVVKFSATNGQGADDVIAAISQIVSQVEERQAGSLFRMPMDRVFTMKGFGTVVTGTAISGNLSLGDTVMIYPGEKTTKVRGLQVHNDSVSEVAAGLRTAVNLQGLNRDEVERGQVLAHPNTLRPSKRMDVWIQYLPGNEKPFKNRTRVRFHVGTVEILGILLLLDKDELTPGQTGLAQIQLEKETVTLSGDRFVLRSYSPVRTIAGGEILHPHASRHKRFNDRTLAELTVLREHDPVKSLKGLIDSAGTKGSSAQDLAALIDLPGKKIKAALDQILSKQEAIIYDKAQGNIISRTAFDNLSDQVLNILKGYHEKYPLRAGLNKEEFKTRVPALSDNKLLTFVLDSMLKSKAIDMYRDEVRLSGHRPNLAEDHQEIEKKLLSAYEKAGLTPPSFKDVSGSLTGTADQQKEVLDLLLKKGKLVKVKSELFFHHKAINQAREQLLAYFQGSKELTTPQFKEMTGLTRKYLIPLLEHFDAQGLTMRVGDIRILRKEGK
ncbi:MAG: selenocysteine-specific translation elongation factor [Deltaproteobacteria bacterium]|nr:selenocysteine-specific translation elongation factor [Deltaproteobacteria bacterium]MBW2050665.1 selenocysteine-specific translation elongation factor [Deltaproteobacteria bacterium]MBW2139583.1 selenocysteine-specific translation elongation factor [Deltaproteobacteria bacterium]MBW2322940.1 selenocysteine-specific translation elongation factor [Deltaproteobacteria bacterium]